MSHWRPGIQLACLGSVAALGLLNVPQVLAQQAPPAHAPPPSWYAWAPKSTAEHPWKAPQKPIWRLSEIVAAHQGHASWTEQIVLDHDYDAKYIQMAPGEKTRTLFWADDRIFFVVWGGQIRFTIQGQQPFVAAKGFLVQVPYRTPYSMETVGSEPALRFEVVRSGRTPLYPTDSTATPPAAPPGKEYIKTRYVTPPDPYTDMNKPYVDFEKDYVHNPANPQGDFAFVKDTDNFMNIIRGPGIPTPPDTSKGHFHIDYNEFWFIAEGKIDYLMEGMKVFTAEPGDVVYAPMGRWHRASFGGNTIDTRIAINPRPEGMHNFDPNPPARP
jgi:mannose-6-phosphate isomerase-like protein (cupin superfamily)